jgi:hypothetical protein
MSGNGADIAAAYQLLSQVAQTMNEHSRILSDHTRVLNERTLLLHDHGRWLENIEHGQSTLTGPWWNTIHPSLVIAS